MFSPAQAAAVTGLPIKAVQKAIEVGAIPARVVASNKRGRHRCLSASSLICLDLQAKGLKDFPLEVRKAIFQEVFRHPRSKNIRHGHALTIDIETTRREVAAGLCRLRKATHMVASSPNILAGTPVFRGTRVPVYVIAEMVQAGVSVEEILENYPALSRGQVELSTMYAAANPRRGRPPVQPWREKEFKARKQLTAAYTV